MEAAVLLPSSGVIEWNRSLLFFKVSQYAFAMCSYREKKSEPTEFVQLDGFTIDYMPEPDQGMKQFEAVNLMNSLIFSELYNQGGKYFFT